VAANRSWLRVVVALLGVTVLLWGADVSVPRLFWSLALVVVLLVVVQILVGTGNASRPGPARPRVTSSA
jgi:heme A synthase